MTTYQEAILNARKEFLKLNSKQEKELLKLYTELANQLKIDISRCRTTSQERYLKNLHEIVKTNIIDLNTEVGKMVKNNIETSSEIASSVDLAYYKAITDDVALSTMFQSNVLKTSRKTVSKLVQGKFYEDKKSLDARIWSISNKSIKDIDTLVKVNILRGANARELAMQVDKYVNPVKRIEAKTLEVGMNKSVSYQAQRLARTSISHAFIETSVENAKINPLNIGLKWNLSASHGARMHGKSDICDDYARNDSYGLGTGVFPADKYPIEHPNGLCYPTEVNTPIDDAIKRLKDWSNGKANKDLDEWYEENKY